MKMKDDRFELKIILDETGRSNDLSRKEGFYGKILGPPSRIDTEGSR